MHLATTTSHNQPGRAIVASKMMDYCRSDQNKSPDKKAQLMFLRSNKLIVAGHHIDVKVGNGAEDVVFARYYTHERTSKGISWRCQFGLVTEPLAGQAKAYFERDGRPFSPGPNVFCLSTKPPRISPDPMAATLVCDQVVYKHPDPAP